MDNETVLVKQFNHQVSGRAKIVSLSLGEVNQDIGKPLNKTELDFYETVPKLLQGFIPCYKGTIRITKEGVTKFTPCNKLLRMRKPSGEPCKKAEDYIVLEDITHSFNKPTILDLKMGTRQYSDGMNSSKIARKKQRSLDTTSDGMGMRIAGIRSYCKRTKSYRYMDKMSGRLLTKSTVADAFQLFLSDGVSIRRETVPHFLLKIQRLIELIQKLKLRLYCCSLLLLYEACPDTNKPKIDLRIIDFAEFQRCTGDGKEYSGPDRGFLLGLNSLVDQFKAFLEEGQTVPRTLSLQEQEISEADYCPGHALEHALGHAPGHALEHALEHSLVSTSLEQWGEEGEELVVT